MKRLFVLLALLLGSAVSQASMVLLAVAVAPSQSDDVTANEKLLLAAIKDKSGASLYADKAWHGLHFLTGDAYDSKSVLGQAIMGGRPVGRTRVMGQCACCSPSKSR